MKCKYDHSYNCQLIKVHKFNKKNKFYDYYIKYTICTHQYQHQQTATEVSASEVTTNITVSQWGLFQQSCTSHRRQWISPNDRGCRAACGTECLPHVVELLTSIMATWGSAGTGCWYGAKDDCNRVFTTSSGHVITTPTVPPTLQQMTSNTEYAQHNYNKYGCYMPSGPLHITEYYLQPT